MKKIGKAGGYILLLSFMSVTILAFSGFEIPELQTLLGNRIDGDVDHDSDSADFAVDNNSGCSLLRASIINVSQADSILIESPQNKTILIDTGSSMKKDSASAMMDYLISNNITRIDHLLLTHYHEDHIGGMRELSTADIEIKNIYHNGNCDHYSSKIAKFTETFAIKNNATTISSDTTVEIDECTVAKMIVAYDRKEGCWNNENDNSILLRLIYGNTSMLFTGDCEGECEEELLAQQTELGSDVLKIGHHASRTSSSDDFLEEVDADYYIISADKNRSAKDGYYHPRKEVLSRIYDFGGGGKTFRTDLDGTVTVVSDGKNIAVGLEGKNDDCLLFMGYGSSNPEDYSIIGKLENQCNK
jgi:competence protein ComEC